MGYGGGHGSGGWGGHGDRMSSLGGGLRSVDWSTAKLSVFEKNFYAEDRRVSSRTEREIEEFRHTKEIKVGLNSTYRRWLAQQCARFKVGVFHAL